MTPLEKVLATMDRGTYERSNYDRMNLNDNPTTSVIERDGTKKHLTVGNSDTITSLITGSQGDANISIVRTGASIAKPLPYVLFGLQSYASKFASILPQYIPTGLTCVVTTDNVGNLVFTYSDGENTDVITVSYNGNICYVDFLNAQNQNYFTTKYIKYDISDETYRTIQYKEMINFGLSSALGAKNANQLQPSSRRMSWDFQKDIVNILIPEQRVTADFSFIQNIIAVDGFTVTWDIFMATRENLNNIAR